MKNIRIRPTFFIGLGGTGYEVLLRLKKLFTETFQEIPPCITFLAIDTAEPKTKAIETKDGESITLIPQQEVNIIQLANTEGLIDEKNPDIQSWWPHGLQPTEITNGSSQTRAKGRLALHADIASIKQILNKKYEEIFSFESNQRMRQAEYGQSDRNGMDVYIINSLAGGTGSGMMLDMAVLARLLDKETSHITGVFVLPKIFDDNSSHIIKANAYGALKEIEHFVKIKGEDDYSTFVYESEMINIKRSPFDFIYLIDNVNGGHDGLKKNLIQTKETLFSQIAKGLFIQTGTALGRQIAENLDNIKNQIERDSLILGRSPKYASFGFSCLHIDEKKYYEEKEASSTKLAERLIEKIVGTKNKSPLSQIAEQFQILRDILGGDKDIFLPNFLKYEKGFDITIIVKCDEIKSSEMYNTLQSLREEKKSERNRLATQLNIISARKIKLAKEILNNWWDRRLDQTNVNLSHIIADIQFLITQINDEVKNASTQIENNEISLKRYTPELEAILDKVKKLSKKGKFYRFFVGEIINDELNSERDNFLKHLRSENEFFIEGKRLLSVKEFLNELIEFLKELESHTQKLIQKFEMVKKDLTSATVAPNKTQQVNTSEDSFTVFLPYIYDLFSKEISYEEFLAYLKLSGRTLKDFQDAPPSSFKEVLLNFIRNQISLSDTSSIQKVLEAMSDSNETKDKLSKSLQYLSNLADPLWEYDKAKIARKYHEIIKQSVYFTASDIENTSLVQQTPLLSFNGKVSFVPSDDTDKLTIFKLEVGVPLFALKGILNMKNAYEKSAKPAYNHIDQRWTELHDILPANNEYLYYSLAFAEPFALLEDNGEIKFNGNSNGLNGITLGRNRIEGFRNLVNNRNYYEEIKLQILKIKSEKHYEIIEKLEAYLQELRGKCSNTDTSQQLKTHLFSEIESVEAYIKAV